MVDVVKWFSGALAEGRLEEWARSKAVYLRPTLYRGVGPAQVVCGPMPNPSTSNNIGFPSTAIHAIPDSRTQHYIQSDPQMIRVM